MGSVLNIEELSVDYKLFERRITALKKVSFSIPTNKTTALVGESGSGKTACCQAIMGLLPKNGHICHGHIFFTSPEHNKPIDLTMLGTESAAYRKIRGQSMSMIFQEPMVSLSPLHTIGDQVSEALLIKKKMTKKEAAKRTKDILHAVGFSDPQGAYKRYPFELSGGLRQRAMIAMALICKPSILIADEPTTALDVTIQAQILTLLKSLQDEFQMAILLITHDMGVVAAMADYVVVLYQGEVIEKGCKNDIFYNAQHPYLKNLLKAVPTLLTDRNQKLPTLYDRDIEKHFFPIKDSHNIQTQYPLLDVSGVCKSFFPKKTNSLFKKAKPVVVLQDIDFCIYPGETFGLVGESGCGKTTLCKILLQGIAADKGDIKLSLQDKSINISNAQEKELRHYRQHVQYIFQDPQSALNPKMTIQQILREPFEIHGRGSNSERQEWAIKLLQLVGLQEHDLGRYPHHFSGGQKQRINIARAIALQPELILCDEPVSALDVSIQAQILNLLKELQSDLNLTYLFISHNMAIVKYMADRIAVMARGCLVELGTSEKLFQNPVHPYTRALIESVLDISFKPSTEKKFNVVGSFSDPVNWEEPFCLNINQPSCWVEVEAGHFVRLQKGKTL